MHTDTAIPTSLDAPAPVLPSPRCSSRAAGERIPASGPGPRAGSARDAARTHTAETSSAGTSWRGLREPPHLPAFRQRSPDSNEWWQTRVLAMRPEPGPDGESIWLIVSAVKLRCTDQPVEVPSKSLISDSGSGSSKSSGTRNSPAHNP